MSKNIKEQSNEMIDKMNQQSKEESGIKTEEIYFYKFAYYSKVTEETKNIKTVNYLWTENERDWNYSNEYAFEQAKYYGKKIK